MRPRVKDALLWGLVGLLTFLVLVQGYEIVQGVGVDLLVKAIGAIVVGVASAVATYVTRGRMLDAPLDAAGENSENADGE